MDLNIDFSNIYWFEIRKLGITMEEVIEVVHSSKSALGFIANEEFLIGFSSRRKFIVVSFCVSKNVNFDIEILDIDLPYEEDIAKIWCPNQ